MAGAKEIKTKVASVQSTQKFTKVMEMVVTSKMRKRRIVCLHLVRILKLSVMLLVMCLRQVSVINIRS